MTSGHVDVIERARARVRSGHRSVAPNIRKELFTTGRVEMLRGGCREFSGVEVDSFSGLLVNYAVTAQCDCAGAESGVRRVRTADGQMNRSPARTFIQFSDDNREHSFSAEYHEVARWAEREDGSAGG